MPKMVVTVGNCWPMLNMCSAALLEMVLCVRCSKP